MKAQQTSNSSETVKTQQISNPSETVKTQQISNHSGMETQQISNPSETVKMQQISNSSVPTSVQPHPLPFILTYPLFSTMSKSVLILLFNNLAICITIHYYPTDPPPLPTQVWAFPPPPSPIQNTHHEVPNPSHTQYSSMTLYSSSNKTH